MEVPVYLINGFLESGKSTLILETLRDPSFQDGAKTLLILCEDGEVEYSKKELKSLGVTLYSLEEESEVESDFLVQLNNQYCPERVFVEFNGMWDFESFLNTEMPKGWVVAQILTTIDATTFQNYINNFRVILTNQFRFADTVIINRCTSNTDRMAFRRIIKPVNQKGQIVYEMTDGSTTTNPGEGKLPFDISKDLIEIADEDYGLWYLDAMDHPKRYEGKTLRFLAYVYKPDQFSDGLFVPGRFAMTCCVNDTRFIGFYCKMAEDIGPITYERLESRMWIRITAKVKVETRKEYHGQGIVLHALKVEAGEVPKERLVYFT